MSDTPTASRVPGSNSTGTDADADGDAEPDVQLAELEDVMGEAHQKVTNGRVYDAENELVRIAWLQAYADLAAEHRRRVEGSEQ